MDGPARTTLECGHSFHPGCFHRPALTGRNRCPRCDDSDADAPRIDWLDDDLLVLPGAVKTNVDIDDVRRGASSEPSTSILGRVFRRALESINGDVTYRHANDLVRDGLTLDQVVRAGWTIQDLHELGATKAHLFAMGLSAASWKRCNLDGTIMAEKFDFGREEVERIFGDDLPHFTGQEKKALGL